MKKPIKVLIVEASEEDAALLIRELQCGGFDPVYEIVATPKAMADALDRQEWDLAISDYSMPCLSGLDALKLLQEKDPDLSFILRTGQVGEEVAVEAMKAGAHDYILKSNPARLSRGSCAIPRPGGRTGRPRKRCGKAASAIA